MSVDLPSNLVNQVSEGKVVLVLGAGASRDAVGRQGRRIPNGKELAALLVERFLTPAHAEIGLSAVAELAINETDLSTVQDFIADLVTSISPTVGHTLLPSLRWRGIVTTNYDTLIEDAYRTKHEQGQHLSPVLSNADRMDDALRGGRKVALLKLHGCVTRTRDPDLPLILTPDQYITHKQNRDRLFGTMLEWGYENTFVFVGHSLQDFDLRQILLELTSTASSRPRYYLVSPTVTQEEERLWDTKRISVIRATFNGFMQELDAAIESPFRGIAVDRPKGEHPITQYLTRELGAQALDYLSANTDFIYPGMQTSGALPHEFYRGYSVGWGAIEQNLDVRRRLVDTILYDVILPDEIDRRSRAELFVIKAEAGAGKSTTLQRVAWEAAAEGRLCVYLRPEGELNYEPIAELARAAPERLFLFVDNAAHNTAALDSVLRRSKRDELTLTIISAERQNEWNIYCDRLEEHLTDSFLLRYLNQTEVKELIVLLERHGALGHLEELSPEEQVKEFIQRAGRQLLVALLEATQGVQFEDILVSEYERITPDRARALYLTVCVLNRLDIPVRAGLIARVHSIPFTEFRERLFKPLEHVVIAVENKSIQDFVYRARHPLIAQVVFERILNVAQRRFDEYLRLLRALNLAYQTDLIAFRQMTRGRQILELFPNHEEASVLLEAAEHLAPNDVPLLHQRGIYEMNRPNGSLSSAHDYLARASLAAPRDLTIVHSLAELERRRAEQATSDVQRRRHRDEARRLAAIVRDDPYHGPFGYHTILKMHLDSLRELLASNEVEEGDVDRALQDIERTLETALQRFPNDEFVLSAEAELADLLRDQERAVAALRVAFERNPRSPFITNRLAHSLQDNGDTQGARTVLETALEANAGERRLHFAYAMLLRKIDGTDIDTMLHHLRRSCTPGDKNYDAQFWQAVYLFMKNLPETIERAREIFRSLWNAPLPYKTRAGIRTKFCDNNGESTRFRGVLVRLDDTYGWILRDGLGDRIYVREEYLSSGEWATLRERDRVEFSIGFSFGGPTAVDIQNLDA